MFIITQKKLFFSIITALTALAVAAMAVFGFTVSVDFKGGSIFEVSYPEGRPSKGELSRTLSEAEIPNFDIRAAGSEGYIVRTAELEEEKRLKALDALSLSGEKEVVEERFSSVGPAVSSELRAKAAIAIAIVLVIIILYVAYAFRKVRPAEGKKSASAESPPSSLPSSWKYGLVAVITLAHDMIVPAGAYAVYGLFAKAEVDVLFVMALLAILGYSVNDTIVIFDRVRENLKRNIEENRKESFDETVGKSVSQSVGRSINTSLTTLFVLLSLFFLGGETTKSFAFLLTAGVIAGAYSSLLLAAPLLTVFAKKNR